jgi:glucose/arabinose dehydrogenase
MSASTRRQHVRRFVLALAATALPGGLPAQAQDQDQAKGFHHAPASAAAAANPLAGNAGAARAGALLYRQHCASCHGAAAQGNGNVPALATGRVRQAPAGALFWFITRGDASDGMPSWQALPESQRWQLVSLLNAPDAAGLLARAGAGTTPAQAGAAAAGLPRPPAPFTDYRYESPGTVRKITAADLPAPYATASAGNAPTLAPRPAGAWPKAPPGFAVGQYADGLDGPRLLRTAPNGDIFVAETRAGRISVFRGLDAHGRPRLRKVFATGLHQPFGLAFYPQGASPQWLYVGDTDAVLRIPYRNGDLAARGEPEHVADLPHGARGHSTRDVRFALDGSRMFVAVGSASNVDDPDTTPAEQYRADILSFRPDGSDMRVYASGIRNPVGLAVDPQSGELWCSVNERDGLGDNLVSDYITHVQEGGFYGWPWWYIGGHQDPRHAGKHPELKDRAIVPDVLLQPHNASLQLAFYDGRQFPAEYRGDIFAAEHGSWNKSVRAGYELIRVPRHGGARASGEYEDFLTGFVLPDGRVWGRPVGVTVAPDGSLLVSDDGSGSIWRVSYTGKR